MSIKVNLTEGKQATVFAGSRSIMQLKRTFNCKNVQNILLAVIEDIDLETLAEFIIEFVSGVDNKDDAYTFMDEYMAANPESNYMDIVFLMMEAMDEGGFFPKKGGTKQIKKLAKDAIENIDFSTPALSPEELNEKQSNDSNSNSNTVSTGTLSQSMGAQAEAVISEIPTQYMGVISMTETQETE